MPQATTDLRMRRIRFWLVLFILGLLLSGATAFPIVWGTDQLARWVGAGPRDVPSRYDGLAAWLVTVRNGVRDMWSRYPWIAYGTDWLGYGIVVLAVLFAGVLRDPYRNVWIIEFGLIACVGVFPIALICGALRGIPWYWRLVDCAFGAAGFVPLWIVRREALALGRADTEGGRAG